MLLMKMKHYIINALKHEINFVSLKQNNEFKHQNMTLASLK